MIVRCVTHCIVQNFIQHGASVFAKLEEFLFEYFLVTQRTQRIRKEAQRQKAFAILCPSLRVLCVTETTMLLKLPEQ